MKVIKSTHFPSQNIMLKPLLILLLPLLMIACTSQPKPEPTVSPFITKPINKTKDTKTNVEQKANDRSKLDPEKQADPKN
jgi:hypothetical protein